MQLASQRLGEEFPRTISETANAAICWSFLKCPRQESNLCTRFRKPLLYPLSYGGGKARLQGFPA